VLKPASLFHFNIQLAHTTDRAQPAPLK